MGAKGLLNLVSVADLIKQGFPESVAKRIASGDLPMDHESKLRRAAEGGYMPQYHASMQDVNEFVPVYEDGLIFTSPSREFANEWVGKGARQKRIGHDPDDEARALRRQREQFYDFDKLNEIEARAGIGDEWHTAYDEMSAEAKEWLARQGNPNDTGKAIYPLMVKAEKTFNPDTDTDLLEGLFSPERLNAPFSSDNPTFRDALKTGNYMLYETPEMVDFLKKNGYDSMALRESTWSKADRAAPPTTLASFNPNNIRSINAAFDPEYTGPNILGGLAKAGIGTGLTAGLLSSEDADAALPPVLSEIDGEELSITPLLGWGNGSEKTEGLLSGLIQAGIDALAPSGRPVNPYSPVGQSGPLTEAQMDGPEDLQRLRKRAASGDKVGQLLGGLLFPF